MARFFVSYSRSVKTSVSEIVSLLHASGHEVWWDGDIPIMADWWATILSKIEWCEVFIFVASDKSVESPYCLAELRYATDRQRPVLPLILDNPATLALPAELPPRGQWLVSEGNAVHLLNGINQAYANIDWALHKDIPAPRPAEPATGGQSLARQFQEARKLANAHEFQKARQILTNIKRLDYGEWGQDCDEWLARIMSYAALVELADDDTTLEKAHAEWREHTRKHGDAFDPAGIRERVSTTRGSRGSRNARLPISTIIAILIALVAIGGIIALASGAFTPHQTDITPTTGQFQNNPPTQIGDAPSPTSTVTLNATAALSITPSATDDLVATQLADLQASQTTVAMMQVQGVQTASAMLPSATISRSYPCEATVIAPAGSSVTVINEVRMRPSSTSRLSSSPSNPLQVGATVILMRRDEINSSQNWYEITDSNSVYLGWIEEEHLELSEACSS